MKVLSLAGCLAYCDKGYYRFAFEVKYAEPFAFSRSGIPLETKGVNRAERKEWN